MEVRCRLLYAIVLAESNRSGEAEAAGRVAVGHSRGGDRLLDLQLLGQHDALVETAKE